MVQFLRRLDASDRSLGAINSTTDESYVGAMQARVIASARILARGTMLSTLNSQDSAWRERAKAVVPNGMYGHLSTRMLPEAYPQFFARAEGAKIWDVDGTGYIDFM